MPTRLGRLRKNQPSAQMPEVSHALDGFNMVELRHPGSLFPKPLQPKAANEKQKGPLGRAPPHSKVPKLY